MYLLLQNDANCLLQEDIILYPASLKATPIVEDRNVIIRTIDTDEMGTE